MRLFLGIVIEPVDQLKIQQSISQLDLYNLPLKWVAASNYHMTLFFIGERPETEWTYWKEKAEVLSQQLPAFELKLDTLDLFKKNKQAIVWLGSTSWPKPLLDMMESLSTNTSEVIPHLTIGRGHCKHFEHWNGKTIDPITVNVRQMALFESESSESGVVYKPFYTRGLK